MKQSSLYQEFLAEREEILRHKWIESERLGQDIGFERALLDWIRKHREGWRASRRSPSPNSTPSSRIQAQLSAPPIPFPPQSTQSKTTGDSPPTDPR
jgi:hypothetical protein